MAIKSCLLVLNGLGQEDDFHTRLQHAIYSFQNKQTADPVSWMVLPEFQGFRQELRTRIQTKKEDFPHFILPEHVSPEIKDFWQDVIEEMCMTAYLIYEKNDYETLIRKQARVIQELEDKIQTQQVEILTKTQSHDHEQRNNHLLVARNQFLEQEIRAIQRSLTFRLTWWMRMPFRFVYGMFFRPKESVKKLGLLGEIMKAGVRNPRLTTRMFNRKNVSTLLAALKEESPGHIAKNFQAFLFKMTEEAHYMPEDSSKPAKTRVLYIPPNLPEYDKSSGGKRAFRMLELLSQSCEVFVFTLGTRPMTYQQKLEAVGIKVFSTYQREEVVSVLQQVDVLIFAWYYTYFQHIEFTRLFPEARIIVDTVDVHWVREARSLQVWDGLNKEEVYRNKKNEIRSYQAADVIWAVTENDKAAILAEIPSACVEVVSNVHEPVITTVESKEEKNLLFLGGFQHPPNVLAVQQIVDQMLPKIRAQVPEAKLLIAGSRATEEVIQLGLRDGVEFLGFIEESEIPDLYKKSMLSFTPLPFGAGIKGKICEAICYMTPVVTNAVGNEGIGLVNLEEAFISDDNNVLVEMAVNALTGKYDLANMAAAAQKRLEKLVSPAIVQRTMNRSLMPQISICIVTWNRLELLKKCLSALFQFTAYPNFVVLVHSNGCEDGSQEYLQELSEKESRLLPILSESNEVFVLPNNRMMEMHPNNDVVLLNNDVVVTENWLMGLYRAAYASEYIGISGAKILYPDGRLQEFGSELYADGTGRNIGKYADPAKDAYSRITEVGYVSGCAMFIKRSTINEIGYLDEQFHPCYYEDSDFCYTAKEQGLKTVVTPWSLVYHEEGATSGTDSSKGFKAYQEVNRKKFVAKHKGKRNGILWESGEVLIQE